MWGAGILSVLGVSFTTVPIAQAIIAQLYNPFSEPGVLKCANFGCVSAELLFWDFPQVST